MSKQMEKEFYEMQKTLMSIMKIIPLYDDTLKELINRVEELSGNEIPFPSED